MATTTEVGYLLPTRERIMAGVHDARPIVDLAVEAERLGYDSLWIGDSVTAKPRHEAMTMLAAIAARTSRAMIGSAVLLPMLRNPVLLAHQAATVDQLSDGRLILGVGTARDAPVMRAEFEATGAPFEKRIGRMLEGIELARALWKGGPVDWDGRWRLEAQEIGPMPARVGGPPVWGGGAAEGALKRAGRYFGGWFPSGPSDPAQYRENWKAVQGFADAAGRDPANITPALYLTVSIDPDQAKADAALDAYLAAYYNQPAERVRAQQAAFAGPTDAVVAWIGQFVEAGCRHLCIRPVGDTMEQMARVAELRPAFAA